MLAKPSVVDEGNWEVAAAEALVARRRMLDALRATLDANRQRVTDLFRSMDATPLGAASIGQVTESLACRAHAERVLVLF